MTHQGKRKIINDPVFGFISIPSGLLYELVKHPFLQRLSRIKQLGLASVVYPGAQHTRFHHSIGAFYLMSEAITHLKSKGIQITPEEEEGALAAVLMHDIGHAPFSHVLEHTLIERVTHEDISLLLMNQINLQCNGKLDVAIAIFKDEYPKHFLHQLVSGQLDVDRMDYLRRDSFFTGVTEGNIGSARIMKMLGVKDDKLVVEAKGIYSIENFLTARRLMYWQVYYHKTAVAAEMLLVNILKRAKELASDGIPLFASPALHFFLYNSQRELDFTHPSTALENYLQLDDSDFWSAMKVWSQGQDMVLSLLCKTLIERVIYKIEVCDSPISDERIERDISYYCNIYNLSKHEASYLVASSSVSTNMYSKQEDSIDIIYNDGSIKNIAQASDMLNLSVLSKEIKKYFYCYIRR